MAQTEIPKNKEIITTPEEQAKLDAEQKAKAAVLEKGKAERTPLQEEAINIKSGAERENPAKEMHRKYLATTEKINEAEAKTDEEFIKKASIKDLRKKSRLLNAKPATEEKPIEQIVNLKDETARRLRAYTNTRDNEWYTLDYKKFGSDTNGSSHEMNIGLGDVLLDNDIEEVLIMRANGDIVKGHKQIIKSKKRVGFADENGQYIATFTGDKFRILSDKEVDIKNEKEVATYIKDLKEQDTTREMAEVEITRNRGGFSSIGIESARKIAELTGEIRTKEPNLSDKDVYLKSAELAREKAKTATSEEEKRQWEIAAKDCEQNIEAITVHPDFDLTLYKRKIQAVESGGSYKARNDEAGRSKGISSDKWAFGRYQFLAGTARANGAEFDPTNEESIQGFLNNPVLQEEVMNNFTISNLKLYEALPEQKKQAFKEAGIDIYEILAAMHFKGAGARNQTPEKLSQGSDWLGGSMTAYWATMDKVQPVDTLIAQAETNDKTLLFENGKETLFFGSSTVNGLKNLNKDRKDVAYYDKTGASPQKMLKELTANILPKLELETNFKWPKTVMLLGMALNGGHTAEEDLNTYLKIAKIFEAKGCRVKFSLLQLAENYLPKVQEFNRLLKTDPRYSSYFIDTGIDTPDTRLAEDGLHLAGKKEYAKIFDAAKKLNTTEESRMA